MSIEEHSEYRPPWRVMLGNVLWVLAGLAAVYVAAIIDKSIPASAKVLEFFAGIAIAILGLSTVWVAEQYGKQRRWELRDNWLKLSILLILTALALVVYGGRLLE